MVSCLAGFFEVFGWACELFKIGIDWQLIFKHGNAPRSGGLYGLI
jgi:hypothetical protein